MIRITKPADGPDILNVTGRQKCELQCRDYLNHRAEYDSGRRKFDFDVRLYGADSVTDALVAAQHSKCCFCERKVGNDGDVEHYRPKASCRQSASGHIQRPGYYWLAYDWYNLLLSCSACNQRKKRNLFPLNNPELRATSHVDDISIEQPLFVNPAFQDPEQFIGFRREIAFAVDGNASGVATIRALQLNREILNEVRRDRLAEIDRLGSILKLEALLAADEEGKSLVNDARSSLSRAVSDAGEFAAIARSATRASDIDGEGH